MSKKLPIASKKYSILLTPAIFLTSVEKDTRPQGINRILPHSSYSSYSASGCMHDLMMPHTILKYILISLRNVHDSRSWWVRASVCYTFSLNNLISSYKPAEIYMSSAKVKLDVLPLTLVALTKSHRFDDASSQQKCLKFNSKGPLTVTWEPRIYVQLHGIIANPNSISAWHL